jgi:hypothetical protein
VVNEALPSWGLVPVTGKEPRLVAPSKNSTAPVGLTAPVVTTLAVKVTDVPKEEGLGEATSVVVLACFGVACACRVPVPMLRARRPPRPTGPRRRRPSRL